MPGKRIGVLTFHRCINYGSYWQARCLAEGLRAAGHDAVLMDHRSRRIDRREWLCALAPVPGAPASSTDRRRYASKVRRFFEAFEHLPASAPFDMDAADAVPAFDLAVVGSDEVWNLRHPWYGGVRLFYGDGLSRPMVSYAASFGNQSAGEGLDSRWATRLAAFSAISVRDQNSQQLVGDALASNPELVLDPCLQFPEIIAGRGERRNRPYLAVYGHSFPDWFVEAVRCSAQRRKLPLVSIGYRNDWADQQWIDAGPLEFAGFMANASCVATNFFHGCVFSLLNHLPFVCAPSAYRNTKVSDLLDLLASRERLLSEGSGVDEVALLLERPPDGAATRIATLRERSARYLQHAVH